MAYIPTIHTFEDDINENRGFDQAPISGGVESINSRNILVSEKPKSSLSKKILMFIAVLFILGSVGILGYYFYGKWQAKKEEARINTEATIQQDKIVAENNLGAETDLAKIFPILAPNIQKYVATAIMKNNIIVLTLNDTSNGIDNYSSIYGYILAHKNDLNKDLFYAFSIQDKINALVAENGLDETYTSNDNSTTSKINKDSNLSKPIPVKAEDLTWESKSLNNQNFEIANAGILNFVYGYSGHNYVIFTTSIKDYFDTLESLK